MILKNDTFQVDFEISGKGPSLLLVHGFLEDKHYWDALARRLSSKYQVIAIDLPGSGESKILGREVSMKLMAEMIRSMPEHLKASKVALVGHSFGGYVALAMAEYFPEYISALMLVNSTAKPDDEQRKAAREKSIECLQSGKMTFLAENIPNLFDSANRAAYREQIEAIQAGIAKRNPKDIIEVIKAIRDRPNRVEVLKNLKADKYIISGEADALLSSQDLKAQAEETGSQYVLLKGGHMSVIEASEAVLQAISAMMDKHSVVV